MKQHIELNLVAFAQIKRDCDSMYISLRLLLAGDGLLMHRDISSIQATPECPQCRQSGHRRRHGYEGRPNGEADGRYLH
jgi:hypothetical protein